MCVAGTPWRKRTRVFTDLHLRSQRCFCRGKHKHIRLVGWSRQHNKPWTRVAQEYPKRFCFWIADAILVDAGFLPLRRRVSVAELAKETNGRIEASNPGPRRRGPRLKRSLANLLHSSLVETSTEILGERIWKSFHCWCLNDLSPEAFDSLSSQPELLCSLVELFGEYLFSEGHSLYLLRQLDHHLYPAYSSYISWPISSCLDFS